MSYQGARRDALRAKKDFTAFPNFRLKARLIFFFPGKDGENFKQPKPETRADFSTWMEVICRHFDSEDLCVLKQMPKTLKRLSGVTMPLVQRSFVWYFGA